MRKRRRMNCMPSTRICHSIPFAGHACLPVAANALRRPAQCSFDDFTRSTVPLGETLMTWRRPEKGLVILLDHCREASWQIASRVDCIPHKLRSVHTRLNAHSTGPLPNCHAMLGSFGRTPVFCDSKKCHRKCHRALAEAKPTTCRSAPQTRLCAWLQC